MRNPPFVAAAGVAIALAGAAWAQDGTITARMTTADGTDAGVVTLQEMRAGVWVRAELTDLPPGPHGFHIHQTGTCTPDFAAAGEHLAPDGSAHGFAAEEHPHGGDLPNLVAAADGTASVEFVNPRVTMEEILDEDGAAVIVHAQADTYADPDSAGERLACGVVEQQS